MDGHHSSRCRKPAYNRAHPRLRVPTERAESMLVAGLLIFLGLLSLCVWLYLRSRDSFARMRDESAAREAQFFAATAAAAAGKDVPASEANSPLPELSLRESSVLDRQERLVYLLLKVALPECEILARVDALRLLPLTEGISPFVIDFMVCGRDFKPLAAIDLDRSERPEVAGRARRVQLLRRAGLRFLVWRFDELPARADVRPLVLGQT
ncbi:hypothetical protein [Niveibacterium sp. SC-1]|uniref:hypothetical protein n=1 Tax=Niveibacterium sp. SC-1 TaxID=3135646 RepID=UPI00311D7E39